MNIPPYYTGPVPEGKEPEPNLITGAGHGHSRQPSRERPKKGAHKRKHKKIKASKISRRINRK